jgi:histidine kinase
MRLTLKFALAICIPAILLSFGAALLFSRDQERRENSYRDASIRSAMEAVVGHCEVDPNGIAGSDCLEALRIASRAVFPEAFLYSALVGEGFRVVQHSDFLKGDYSLRGVHTEDPVVGRAYLAEGWVRQEEDLSWGTGGRRVLTAPVLSDGKGIAILVCAYDIRKLRGTYGDLTGWKKRRLAQASLIGAGAGLAFSLAISFFLLKRIRGLAEAARRVAEGDLKCRAPEGGWDELGDVSACFNRMVERREEREGVRSGFMSRITHNLMNPVNAVMAQADVLLDGCKGPLNHGQMESAAAVLRSSQELAECIGNIHNAARLDSACVQLRPESVDLGTEILSVLDRLRPRAEEWRIALEYHIGEGISRVRADPEAFRTILTNLVSNALKFTHSGGVVVVTAGRDSAGEVLVTVRDTGVGIPVERMERLFEMFYQVPETHNKVRPSSGTGLGLFICKRLVEAQGGRIWVESDLFKGAMFHFTVAEAKLG